MNQCVNLSAQLSQYVNLSVHVKKYVSQIIQLSGSQSLISVQSVSVNSKNANVNVNNNVHSSVKFVSVTVNFGENMSVYN